VNGTFYRDFDAVSGSRFWQTAPNENKTTGYLRTAQLTYNGKNAGLGNLKLDIGYMEPDFSFERGISSNNTFFLERSSPGTDRSPASRADDPPLFRSAAVTNGDNWFRRHLLHGAHVAGRATATALPPLPRST